jgi:hypothetical protein
MIKISNISIFGFNDLEGNEQRLIKDFIMHIDFHDYKNKTKLNDLIGQIEIHKNEFFIYFFTSPERNQLEIIVGILNYIRDINQFIGDFTFLETSKYVIRYDN